MNYFKSSAPRFIALLVSIWLTAFALPVSANISEQLRVAESLREQGNFPQAILTLDKALAKVALKSKEHTLIMGMKANLLLLQRRYDEAFLILSETQPLAENNQWRLIAADQAHYLANLFLRRQNQAKARRWFAKARQLAQESGDKVLALQSGINLLRLKSENSQAQQKLLNQLHA
ncbi:hypothetical protein LYNGBM3L_51970, partial [Moorena producens 3L]